MTGLDYETGFRVSEVISGLSPGFGTTKVIRFLPGYITVVIYSERLTCFGGLFGIKMTGYKSTAYLPIKKKASPFEEDHVELSGLLFFVLSETTGAVQGEGGHQPAGRINQGAHKRTVGHMMPGAAQEVVAVLLVLQFISSP